ncbi:hypothetical protein J6590_001259 [Homalodisca vitripennis]|nr:hypothetical protein J6590_001259 [Homalodisca vitripennis]
MSILMCHCKVPGSREASDPRTSEEDGLLVTRPPTRSIPLTSTKGVRQLSSEEYRCLGGHVAEKLEVLLMRSQRGYPECGYDAGRTRAQVLELERRELHECSRVFRALALCYWTSDTENTALRHIRSYLHQRRNVVQIGKTRGKEGHLNFNRKPIAITSDILLALCKQLKVHRGPPKSWR